MRSYKFLVFFSVVLLIYIFANIDIFFHGYWALKGYSLAYHTYTIFFLIFAISYFLSRFVEKINQGVIHSVLYLFGALWFAALLYFFLIVLLVDTVRFVDLFFHFLPAEDTPANKWLKLSIFSFSIVSVFSLLVYGYINAFRPVIRRLELFIPKRAGSMDNLVIAMVSDVHLGGLINKKRVSKLVGLINGTNPDMVLFAGDILDEVQAPIFQKDIGSPIRNLSPKYGVFGITGNHEYIGGIKNAVDYIEKLNINLLRDEVVEINNSFYLAGREDKDVHRFEGKVRSPLNKILKNVDMSHPVILLDHQPFRLHEAVDNHVDLQLSGHTHHGQFWPLNFITRKIYEISWGYKLIDHTNFYVSCGYGTWGPPVRIGNKPEIVLIHLKFQPAAL